jgi:ribose/xylose/arabinose/galactoside ABC-type transport system permease subunit
MIAVGMGVLLISGNVDLSAGSIGCMASLICAWCMQRMAWGLAVLVAVAFGACAGLINVLLTNVFNIMPFIGTMGISYVWQGLAAYITKNRPVLVEDPIFIKIGSPILFGFIPISFAYVVLLCLIYGFILSRTKFGRQVYMCGGNMAAARLSGVNITRIGTIMMINCSVICAFGGIVLSSRMHQITSDSMTMALMNSMTGAFLGGISFGGGSGGMLGAFIGLLVLNFFNNGLIMIGMNPYWQIFAQGILLIVALVVEFFNSRARIKALKAA